MNERQAVIPRRLVHFTPLRYPGGKSKLAEYVKSLLSTNGLEDGEYVEPYAGGAGIALELLLQEYVTRIHINDVSNLVFSFWWSVLNDPEELSRRIINTPCDLETWDKQKAIIANPDDHSTIDVGFATFFLNRTNRSGILNGGVIGGRKQAGPWKIDARYNASELLYRIGSIARLAGRVSLTRLDAVEFIKDGVQRWPKKTLIYLDPPYYAKGRDLYYNFYRHDDHADVAEAVQRLIVEQSWIVSYDNVPEIRELYSAQQSVTYSIGYSARDARQGSEVMFFSEGLRIPALVGPITAPVMPTAPIPGFSTSTEMKV